MGHVQTAAKTKKLPSCLTGILNYRKLDEPLVSVA